MSQDSTHLATGRHGPGRVLVVEDDYLVAADIEGELTAAGYEVVGIAGTAHEAVALARSRRPAIVIMDIRLRGGADGIEAATEIYRETGIRSIFASANQDPATRRRGEAARPLAWLAKPYTGSTLVRLLRDALGEDRRGH
jgi:DNA-binding NarL/FixJ family response regulator